MKRYLQTAIIMLTVFMIACQKEINTATASTTNEDNITTAPFTDRDWYMDTIIVTPPATYDALSDSDKTDFNHAWAWLKVSIINFKTGGAISCDQGNWDFGYNSWRIINNNKDIEVTLSAGKDTLRSWSINNSHFSYNTNINSYNTTINASTPATFIYK